MSPLTLVYQKLGEGLDILATTGEPVRDRLMKAFLHSFADVPEDALPPEARARWRTVWQRVTAAQPKQGEGGIVSSIRALSEEEATVIAGHLVTIHAMVQLAMPARQASMSAGRPVAAGQARTSGG